jgi:hypothetical protein
MTKKGSSGVTKWQFKCLLAWQSKAYGDLHKIIWSGETIFGISHLPHRLLIRCNANYHITTWCEMQTGIWMTYSDSKHFSEQFLYKIHFVSSYRLKDMNFARYTTRKTLICGAPIWASMAHQWCATHIKPLVFTTSGARPRAPQLSVLSVAHLCGVRHA